MCTVETIRQQIREHQDSQRLLRQQAQSCTDLTRHVLNLERTAAKRWGRILYLVYALLRGTPYRALEKKSHEPLTRLQLASVAERAGKTEEEAHAWICDEAEDRAAA